MNDKPSTETLIFYADGTLKEQLKKTPNDYYLKWFIVVFSIMRQWCTISDKTIKETMDSPNDVAVVNSIKSLRSIVLSSNQFISFKDLVYGTAWLITTSIAFYAAFLKQ